MAVDDQEYSDLLQLLAQGQELDAGMSVGSAVRLENTDAIAAQQPAPQNVCVNDAPAATAAAAAAAASAGSDNDTDPNGKRKRTSKDDYPDLVKRHEQKVRKSIRVLNAGSSLAV